MSLTPDYARLRAEVDAGHYPFLPEDEGALLGRCELLEAKALRLHAALRAACDVAVWMSGSPSFGPEGEAHEGWAEQRERLYEAMAVLQGG